MNYVGVDVGKKYFECWDQRKRAIQKVENTKRGVEEFLSQLKKDDVLVIDPAGGYEKNLIRAAAKKGVTVYVGDNYATSKLSKIFHRGKTDSLDAKNMCLRGEKGLLKETQLYTQDQKTWVVEDLMEEYKAAEKSSALNRNHTVKLLDEILPGIHILGSGPAALKFYLEHLTPQGIEKLQSGGLEEVRKTLRRYHWKLEKKAEAAWEVISRYKEEGAAEFKLKMLGTYTQRLLQDLIAIKEIKEKLKEELKNMEGVEKALKIPGVGTITIASIIATAGRVEKFRTAKDLERFLGMDLVPRESGQHKGKRKISKKGNGTARKHIYLAALAATRQDTSPFHKYYLQKIGKGKKPALVAVMRKLLRTIYTVWKNRLDYNPNLVGTGAPTVTAPVQ